MADPERNIIFKINRLTTSFAIIKTQARFPSREIKLFFICLNDQFKKKLEVIYKKIGSLENRGQNGR